MNPDLVFGPVLAQIALTLFVYVWMARAKQAALARDEVDLARRALHPDAWPDAVLKLSNNIRNQFETPVLFYVLAGMLWALDAVTGLVLALAWAYVASRMLHLAIHAGINVVPIRRRVFSVGVLILAVLWVLCLLALLAGPAGSP